jgi:large subunit ribosomal protein L28
MALKCDNCGKGVMYGHNVSHAKNRTRKIFKPNLHSVKVVLDGVSKRLKLCVKCLRMAKQLKKTQKTGVQAEIPTEATIATA